MQTSKKLEAAKKRVFIEERKIILAKLREADFFVQRAARFLDCTRGTLYKALTRHKIKIPGGKIGRPKGAKNLITRHVKNSENK